MCASIYKFLLLFVQAGYQLGSVDRLRLPGMWQQVGKVVLFTCRIEQHDRVRAWSGNVGGNLFDAFSWQTSAIVSMISVFGFCQVERC